jgi:hypothetical protein
LKDVRIAVPNRLRGVILFDQRLDINRPHDHLAPIYSS